MKTKTMKTKGIKIKNKEIKIYSVESKIKIVDTKIINLKKDNSENTRNKIKNIEWK